MQAQVVAPEFPTVKASIKLRTSFDARKNSDIEMILSENQKVVTVLMEKEKISRTEAELLFSDTVKFLFLCSTSEMSLSPTDKLDIGWHHFILNTKEYMKFCTEHLNKYIHHSPFTAQDKQELAYNPVKETKEFAKSVFSDLSKNWNISANSSCCSGGDCSNSEGGCSHCQSE